MKSMTHTLHYYLRRLAVAARILHDDHNDDNDANAGCWWIVSIGWFVFLIVPLPFVVGELAWVTGLIAPHHACQDAARCDLTYLVWLDGLLIIVVPLLIGLLLRFLVVKSRAAWRQSRTKVPRRKKHNP